MKSLPIFAFALVVFSIHFAFATLKTGISATVDGQVITEMELSERMHTMATINNIEIAKVDAQQLREQILHSMIDEKLIAQTASKFEIKVTHEEEEATFQKFANENQLSKEEMVLSLKSKGVNKDEIMKIFSAQVLWHKMIKNLIEDQENLNLIISDQEILEHFEIIKKHNKDNQDYDVRLAEIVVSKDDNAIQQNADGIISAINAGADFGKMSREISISASRENDGDIGWVRLSQLAPKLLEHVKKMKIGNISAVIDQGESFVIFKLLDKKASTNEHFGIKPSLQQEVQIRDFLKMKKINLIIKSYLHSLRKNAFVEIRQPN